MVIATLVVALLGVPSFGAASAPPPRGLDAAASLTGRVAPGASAIVSATLPWRANMIGFSFDGPRRGVEIEARTLEDGRWTGWRPYRLEPEEGPDGLEASRAVPRTFTAAQWVGRARVVQVRATVGSRVGAVRDLRVHAFNTAGDAHDRGPLWRAVRALGSWLSAGPRAEAAPREPGIVTREGWGADERIRSSGPGLAKAIDLAFVHHTTNANDYTRDEGPALVRGIYRYHVVSRGWSDIGYNFLVDRYGVIYEGRWGGMTEPVIGAHVQGFNTGSTGVSLIGTFTDVAPPPEMRDALARLLAWKLDLHHVPPKGRVEVPSGGNSRYRAGSIASLKRISGHRDGSPTACPGQKTYDLLSDIRTATAKKGHPKIYLPDQSRATVRPDGDGRGDRVRFTARFSREVAWRLTITDRAGEVMRRFKGTGRELSKRWNGTSWSGGLLETGRYFWTLEATSEQAGREARPAGGRIYVVGLHPPGTVLTDEAGTYQVTPSGRARALGAMEQASYLGAAPAVATGPEERTRYVEGSALDARDGALFSGSDGTRYIWSGGALRRFGTAFGGENGSEPIDTFTALGYRDEAVIAADDAWIATRPLGAPVESVTAHPQGSIVRDDATGALFVVGAGTRRPLTPLAARTRYRDAEIVPATAADLAAPEGLPLGLRTGALIADPGGKPPWVFYGGERHRFRTRFLFKTMGYTDAMLITATAEELAAVPTGARLG